MRHNLKNRPKSWVGCEGYDKWFQGFEKELRQIYGESKRVWKYPSQKRELIKEILGEC